MELEANFAAEEACRAYLARLRWPAGFRCPRCGSDKAWSVRDPWECAGCRRHTSVTAGTIFPDTRIPLSLVWWQVAGQARARGPGTSGPPGRLSLHELIDHRP